MAGLSLRRLQDQQVSQRRVLARVDFNVPFKQGRVLDDGRIRSVLPTLKYLLEKNAAVALISHLGRPKGVDDSLRMKPVAERLSQLLGRPVHALPDCIGPSVRQSVERMKPGEVLLLENLRFHPQETKNDPAFAHALAEPFELFVQDAFGSVHRAHASTHAIAQCLPSCAGMLVQAEVESLNRLVDQPLHPFVAVIGGKKAEEKVGGLFGLLDRVDQFLIGGGVGNTFLAGKPVALGTSFYDADWVQEARRFMQEAYQRGAAVILPTDVQLTQALTSQPEAVIAPSHKIPDGWMAVDIGPQTAKEFKARIRTAKTLFWAGPLGAFEYPPFDKGTVEVAKAVADSGAFAVVGGGETAAAYAQAKVRGDNVFISTGGGASLEFVSGMSLPGLEVLRA